ncbi:single-stranded DNA-binding protein [Serratia proteamaculans]|uniref:single-stranded DNA-binding protein n=1 Tax=Serratia TaxID=613 RepID=UPI001C5810C8|nr:single-stranded DNA-binding protein [Serratia proteamaculans]WEO89573.1 single-stranded DNA-binding protein [Serratia proteamaculans]
MTAQIAAYGRLVADVQSKTTSNGSTMAFTRMAVSLPCHSAENGEASFWLGVVAFGKQADALARHGKGDMVSVSGNMQVNQWTAQDGSTASGYQVAGLPVRKTRQTRAKNWSRNKPGSVQHLTNSRKISTRHHSLTMKLLLRGLYEYTSHGH